MVDYIIVGLGLAGISFCETLRKHRKTFVVFNDGSQQASQVAGGLYNPVILKRFSPVWMAQQQLEEALPFYAELENFLNIKIDHKLPVLRRFVSAEEQNLWFEAADKPGLSRFLSTKILSNKNSLIDAPFGFGEVLHTGRVDTRRLYYAYKSFLKAGQILVEDRFDYTQLSILDNCVEYKGITAKNLVFCDGFGLKTNPFFGYLPLNGTKGELLRVKIEGLQLGAVLKSSVFLIPLGDDEYYLGATYEWHDKTNTVTEKAKKELLSKLATFLQFEPVVLAQEGGIRPTVADRRPLVGTHPQHKNIHVLNGLGSRGVMIAPFAAKRLYDSIEKGIAIPPEMNIQRFISKYKPA